MYLRSGSKSSANREFKGSKRGHLSSYQPFQWVSAAGAARRVRMRNVGLRAALAMGLALCSWPVLGQETQPGEPAQTPTLQVTSKLVFLDVTVLDAKNRPVMTGLTKDDFQITEDKWPQKIFSFEAPSVHAVSGSGENPEGQAPVTIIVMDQLNSRFEDFAYIRWEAERFLESQPAQLKSPTELMIVGQSSLEMVQNFTRDRGELEAALRHIPAALPYKRENVSFVAERIQQSFDALEQIGLECQGIPGRKNVLWLGVGGPGINTLFLPTPVADTITRYAHSVTNMMVDSRITLFVMYPGLRVRGSAMNISQMDSTVDPGDNDPFGPNGDVNFGLFVNETGGQMFFNRNDVDGEMKEAETVGSEYYTLTYQPHGGSDDGRFRRIRVTMRNPALHTVTKVGYYAPDRKAPQDPLERRMEDMVEAVRATLPFTALPISMSDVLRHPDAQTAELMVQIAPRDVSWLKMENNRSAAKLLVTTAALSGRRDILRMKAQTMTFIALTQDTALIDRQLPLLVDVTIPVTKKTKSVRLVVVTEHGGRVGAVEVPASQLAAAPAVRTPQPHLAAKRPGVPVPASQ